MQQKTLIDPKQPRKQFSGPSGSRESPASSFFFSMCKFAVALEVSLTRRRHPLIVSHHHHSSFFPLLGKREKKATLSRLTRPFLFPVFPLIFYIHHSSLPAWERPASFRHADLAISIQSDARLLACGSKKH
ncbi:uncharacterized protein BO97DRAFT_260243 [Aspergillus homomorphus CBS 101889]|uniref:Uncharacterized protein n=1 Tax=Aspergillus homomorphus (strain CBS 101889) TaxID=1450537 RepID=A0A395I3W7_ASPHC|nr:hypothetical protein BO97DRAFT_260243 [Aspergillus homomorphus CBS 101889]RAL14902.1 hypothetical protein BO97DRAFT_260243 [Aspergillus homomorphus CBS 101889]